MRVNATVRAEEVARSSYGRLLAVLAARTGDITLAEDALADAFEKALRSWPDNGVPMNPEGWIVTVARRRFLDVVKSPSHHAAALPDPPFEADFDVDRIPDKRLELMFVCGHPAIYAGVRTPLMLQTVLGFEAADIAIAYAIPPTTMAQRLVRAKRRIRDARIPFVVPALSDMPARLPAVLEAVYGAYAIDWQLVSGTTERESLAAEALCLATTLATLLRSEPEAFGLAALISLSMARAPARLQDGMLVPLDEQDTALWDHVLIAQGEALLSKAHAYGRIGRFQLEAAIQSVHCARAVTGRTDWGRLRTLYTGLLAVAPTLGAQVSLAAVVGRIDGPAAGLAMLDTFAPAARFQPAWATRAHLLAALERWQDAADAYAKAISLTTEPPLRRYLARQSDQLP